MRKVNVTCNVTCNQRGERWRATFTFQRSHWRETSARRPPPRSRRHINDYPPRSGHNDTRNGELDIGWVGTSGVGCASIIRLSGSFRCVAYPRKADFSAFLASISSNICFYLHRICNGTHSGAFDAPTMPPYTYLPSPNVPLDMRPLLGTCASSDAHMRIIKTIPLYPHRKRCGYYHHSRHFLYLYYNNIPGLSFSAISTSHLNEMSYVMSTWHHSQLY